MIDSPLQMEAKMERKLISAADAAKALGVPLDTVSNYCRKGDKGNNSSGLECVKIGRNWLVYEDSLQNYKRGTGGKPRKNESPE